MAKTDTQKRLKKTAWDEMLRAEIHKEKSDAALDKLKSFAPFQPGTIVEWDANGNTSIRRTYRGRVQSVSRVSMNAHGNIQYTYWVQRIDKQNKSTTFCSLEDWWDKPRRAQDQTGAKK